MSLLTIVFGLTVIAIAVVSLYWILAQRAKKQVKARAAWLNKELERTDSRIEVVEIWSDEQIERNNRELANAILEKMGTDLAADESPEAVRLRRFLAKVRHTDDDSALETPRDLAVTWFACLQLQDQEPAAELAQVFKSLNDPWTASREDQAPISESDQQITLRAITTTLVQGGSRS